MNSLDQSLASWAAKELMYWEQAAFDKILRRIEVTRDDIQELVRYFLEDAGLAPKPANRAPLFLFEVKFGYAELARCRLRRIFNLRNVNALPNGQEIRFGPQLTLIYGKNGAGKSGYARTLASAAIARGVRAVLPNAIGQESDQVTEADIEVSYGERLDVITWNVKDRRPTLPTFHAFDGGSLPAHLTGSNSMNVRPAGLSLLTHLAELTDLVRQEVRVLVEEHDREYDFGALFDGESEAKRRASCVGLKTNLEELTTFANLTDADSVALESLEKEIAKLILLDVNKHIEKRRQEIKDLTNLMARIEKAEFQLGDASVEKISDLINAFLHCRTDATTSGVRQFEFQQFSRVGSIEWREFILAAKTLADAEPQLAANYPHTGEPCLLCRQTLSEDAANLIQTLWAYLRSDAEGRLQTAENACNARESELRDLDLAYFATDSNARRILEEEIPLDVSGLDAQLGSCMQRCQELCDELRSKDVRVLSPLIKFDLTNLRTVIRSREVDVETLERSDIGQRLRTAQRQFLELKHRQLLRQHIPAISKHVEKRRWAATAQQFLGSTRVITTKYNELFGD